MLNDIKQTLAHTSAGEVIEDVLAVVCLCVIVAGVALIGGVL